VSLQVLPGKGLGPSPFVALQVKKEKEWGRGGEEGGGGLGLATTTRAFMGSIQYFAKLILNK
jgi:hypothetical protein